MNPTVKSLLKVKQKEKSSVISRLQVFLYDPPQNVEIEELRKVEAEACTGAVLKVTERVTNVWLCTVQHQATVLNSGLLNTVVRELDATMQ